MFVIDMKKGFRISFIVNIILLVLFIMIFILYITKGPKEKEINPGLQSLIIEEADIDFKPERYAYSIEVDNDIDKLTLLTVPYEKGANIKIDGNKDLQVGYNQIIITISDTATTPKLYYIDVDKKESTENKGKTDNETTSLDENQK